MYKARALLNAPESLSTILQTVRASTSLHLDIPIHSLLPDHGLKATEALHIHGRSGSGKTHVLYYLVIEAILCRRAVIVFDNDLKWDNARLFDLLRQRIPDKEALDHLDQVIVHQPSSLLEFQTQVGDLNGGQVSDYAVRYVVIDTMSAFHWQSVANKTTMSNVYTALKRKCQEIGALLVYTTWDLGFPYMTLPGNTVRLNMQRKYVLQFTQGLEHALETKEHRMEVLNRGICYMTSENSSDRKIFIIKSDKCYFEETSQ